MDLSNLIQGGLAAVICVFLGAWLNRIATKKDKKTEKQEKEVEEKEKSKELDLNNIRQTINKLKEDQKDLDAGLEELSNRMDCGNHSKQLNKISNDVNLLTVKITNNENTITDMKGEFQLIFSDIKKSLESLRTEIMDFYKGKK